MLSTEPFNLPCTIYLSADLEALPYAKLSALQSELESLIQVYNEALVQELALKDEMEFEKELKNNFISLLLAVQNKKRTYLAEKKRKQTNGQLFAAKEKEPQVSEVVNSEVGVVGMWMRVGIRVKWRFFQFVTAVIPYADGRGPPNNATLQALIKSELGMESFLSIATRSFAFLYTKRNFTK